MIVIFIIFVGENINAMKKLTFMLVALMVAMGVQAQPIKSHVYKNPTPGELPILGWFSLKGAQVICCCLNCRMKFVLNLQRYRIWIL